MQVCVCVCVGGGVFKQPVLISRSAMQVCVCVWGGGVFKQPVLISRSAMQVGAEGGGGFFSSLY